MIDYVRFRLCSTILNSNLRICSNSSNGSSNRWDINSIPLVRLNSTLHFYTTISIALQSRDSKIRLSTMKTTYRISFSKVTIVQTTFVEIDARGIKSCFPFKGKTLILFHGALELSGLLHIAMGTRPYGYPNVPCGMGGWGIKYVQISILFNDRLCWFTNLFNYITFKSTNLDWFQLFN